MNVTVCICTYNNSQMLERAIASIRDMRVPGNVNWELLVVNNNCSDDTDTILETFAGKVPLTHEHEPTPGKSHALNHALRVARGELIIFADDDVKVSEGWLEAYWNAYQRRARPRYFGGRITSEFSGYEPDAELLKVAMPSVRGIDYGDAERPAGPRETFIGSNWACPLAALKEVGGFDTSHGLNWGSQKVKVGEETLIMQQLRGLDYEPYYVPNAMLWHDVPKYKCTLEHVLERSRAWGYFDERVRQDPRSIQERSVPRWMYRSWVENAVRIAFRKMLGRPTYQARVLQANLVGRISAARELAKEGNI